MQKPLPLEDSIGDILKKARTSTQVSPETAAAAAGLPVDAYLQLEETGKAAGTVRWREVGQLLTLNGANLEKLAGGWSPQPVDTSQWREFRLITSAGDGMTVNCYLIWDEATREAALFDTGFDATEIFHWIDTNRLTLKHLFITHSHEDHLAALEPIRTKHPGAKLHSNIKSAPLDQKNKPNEVVQLGSLRISHRETPGHADDGVTYIIGNWPEDAPHVAIVGDAIFCGSMGGARENLELARRKVKNEIFSLPEGTLIGSGHGPLTTVGEQKANNPWFA
jgi:hydroxyacylglutathione hydrolase